MTVKGFGVAGVRGGGDVDGCGAPIHAAMKTAKRRTSLNILVLIRARVRTTWIHGREKFLV